MGINCLEMTEVRSGSREKLVSIRDKWNVCIAARIPHGESAGIWITGITGFEPQIRELELCGDTAYEMTLVHWGTSHISTCWIDFLDDLGVDYYVQSYEPNDDSYYMDDEIRSELQEQEEVTELDRILTQKIAAFRNA